MTHHSADLDAPLRYTAAGPGRLNDRIEHVEVSCFFCAGGPEAGQVKSDGGLKPCPLCNPGGQP